MGNNSENLDEWRIYFKTANADIFSVIEHAIMVAAMDFPNELKAKRGSITEMLFTCRVTMCFGCNNVELALPNVYAYEVEAKFQANKFNEELGTGKSNDIEKQTNGDGNGRFEMELNTNGSFEDAEVLSDAIDEECQTLAEVMRIKHILDNHGEESESLVIESLRKLQLMNLSVETLKVTDIGKSVSPLKTQESKQIKQLVRALIENWKVKVDEWVRAVEAVAGTECTPESVKASVEEEEEGLPSPPMDEGAFLTTNTMELSQFFDDMDEDGNIRNSGEFNKNQENGRKTSRENQNIPVRKQQVPKGPIAAPQDRCTEQPKEHEVLVKKPIMAPPQDRHTEQAKAKEAVVKKPIMAPPQDRHTEKPKEQEARMKKPIMAAPQERQTEKPKEREAIMKKPMMAAPQDKSTEQPKKKEAVMKTPLMAAPQDKSTEQPKKKEAVTKAPLMAAPQDGYTEQPKQPVAIMKMAAPRNRHTKQPKEQGAIVKKVSNAAAQDWYTKQPNEQEALVKKPSNAAAQDRCTQQPKEQEAVWKKPSNAAAQEWYTKQPKEQEVLVKKPSNVAAAQDCYTRQAKDQEAVLKKPSNAAAQDWYTPQPKEQEAAVKKSTSIKANKPSVNGSGSGRLTKPTMEHKVNGNAEVKFKATTDKRHAVSQQNKLNCPDETTVQERLAVAKRKLQERNQAIENAKKQRTT